MTDRAMTAPATPPQQPIIRPAMASDLDSLDQLERASFRIDRLSRRRLRHWIDATNSVLLVASSGSTLLGYGLVLLHRGTRLARLYSLAVAPAARGTGLGRRLVQKLELAAADRGRLDMRLEVAEDNLAARALYNELGYVAFGRYDDYYDDHQPALRMQKRIRFLPQNLEHLEVPWYRQTTEFSCGPAAAMMAMAALSPAIRPDRAMELDIWREATTIFMTAGHGGCHPVGLALAAWRRGFAARVHLNRRAPLFVDGVRSAEKKDVVRLVHQQFLQQADEAGIEIEYGEVARQQINAWIRAGELVLALISTYRMDRRKAPHWVTITAVDDDCLYVHDPDPTEGEQSALDCQYMPIAWSSFEAMAAFGRERLAAFVVINASAGDLPA